MSSDEEVFAGLSVGDVLALGVAAVFVGPGLLLVVAGKWAAVTGWATDHGVLAPAKVDPAVPLPGAAGAGFDTARLLFAAVVMVGVVVAIGYGVWLRRRHRLNRLARRGLV